MRQILNARLITKLKAVDEAAMPYTCTISKPISNGKDGYNQPLPPSYVTQPDTVPCRLNQQPALTTGEQPNSNIQAIVSNYTLVVPPGTNVSTDDRVESILNESGNPVDASVQYYEVKETVPAISHLQLVLKVIR